MPPLVREPGGPKVPKKKTERNERLSQRALKDLQAYLDSTPCPTGDQEVRRF
jgi:hypothetical protein